jgi:hypothetical protein
VAKGAERILPHREKAWRSAGLIERQVQFKPNEANAFSVELT